MPETGVAPLRIGFAAALNPHAGGVFQYSATMEGALTAIAARERGLTPVALLPDQVPEAEARLAAAGWATSRLLPPVGPVRGALGRLAGEGPHRAAWRWLRTRRAAANAEAPADLSVIARRDDIAQWWRTQRVDLMLFPQPHPLAFEAGLPYVIAVHDLQHRLQPEFREVSADGEWARREYILRNCIGRAERVLVDSEVGKEHVMLFYESYGARADRVDVLPFLPSPAVAGAASAARQIEARTRHGIPDQFILYPAAFWAHKNHVRIVEAIERLARVRETRVHAVFCGSHAGADREREFQLVQEMASRCGVSDLIHVPGYVSDADLTALYSCATALVMPTFFGPTNIPVLEAWAHGCPVLTSNIPGIREQAGDAAILVEPRDVAALADGMYRLVTDGALRRDLAARGTRRLAEYTPAQFEARLRGSLLRALGCDPAGT